MNSVGEAAMSSGKINREADFSPERPEEAFGATGTKPLRTETESGDKCATPLFATPQARFSLIHRSGVGNASTLRLTSAYPRPRTCFT